MHETLFANQARPARATVMHLPLRPYSIGHEAELWRQKNPLLVSDRKEFDLLPEAERLEWLIKAVDFCSQNHAEFLESQRILNSQPRWHEWALRCQKRRMERVWRDWEALIQKTDLDAAATAFRFYLVDGRGFPPAPSDMARRALGADKDSGGGRSFGSPMIPRLLNFLSARPELIAMHRAEDPQFCLWDFPFGLAVWLYFTQAEQDGSCAIENQDEFNVAEKERQLLAEIEAENAAAKAQTQGT